MQIPLQVNWKEFLDSNSLAHLEIIDALAAGKVSLDLKEKILQLRPQAYLPLPLDYFLDLGLYSEAEKQAIQTINAKSQILFPTGFDYYELSRAYRALASSAWQASKKNEAQKFLLLAKDAQSKIRSIWIEEDLILNHDFLKTTERYSKFGFLIPQWIMAMQNL